MTESRPGRAPGSVPGAGSSSGHGLVLVKGSAKAAARWLRRGLVEAATVELPGWTGVCPAETTARTRAPYDVGLEVLAARPVPRGVRPSIGLFVIDGCAVVTVQVRGWRAAHRWLVWQPSHGVRRTPDLPPLPAALILRVARPATAVTPGDVVAHFNDTTGSPLDRLLGLMDLLGLPGADLLRQGADRGAPRVEPSARTIRSFDALVHGDHLHDPHHPELPS